MSEPTYIICPGMVISGNDHQRHYVGVGALVQLYRLRCGEFVTAPKDENQQRVLQRQLPNAVHLHPRHDGRYGRPDQ